MQNMLQIEYPSEPWTWRPRKLSRSQIEAIAWSVRQQLGYAGSRRLQLPFDSIRRIATLKVNGIKFSLEWSVEHAISNEEGQPVLGLCEYDHEGLPDAVLIHVNPQIVNGRQELLLSTAAHELGHAIFDASSWIAIAHAPVLRGLVEELPRRVQRLTSPDASHLEPGGGSGIVTDWREWRANEFMGSMLVPRALLMPLFLALARLLKMPVHAERAQTSWLDEEYWVDRLIRVDSSPAQAPKLSLLIRMLALRFGVTSRFMEVRLKRYGFLDQSYGRAA
ncbi:MAG: hypothetical protein IRY94_16265 [Rhodospirillaceae bacterium]|nr:hypothetical protein [Rhodospirillaceae bacterium]